MRKFRDVLSRWEAGSLSQAEAAELLGRSERQFRRYVERFEEEGEAGLLDRRLGKPSAKAIAAAERERMLELYKQRHRGWTAKHFHEHGRRHHAFTWGYTWTKTQLHAAGLLERAPMRGKHRKKRERKPCAGMMLHQDGSRHAWLAGAGALDLIVTMDDATSEIYSAFLVEEEGTLSTFQGLMEVMSAHGLPCSLYTDRGSHYFHTPEAGGKVDKSAKTQVGRALAHLGVEHIAAYSPEARGRSERMFGTLQDRLVKELALAGIRDVATANAWIKETFLPEHNALFARPARLPESAFVPVEASVLAEVLVIEEERVVARDNTISLDGLVLQIPHSPIRPHYAKTKVKVRTYPNGSIAIFHGPRQIARFAADGTPDIDAPAEQIRNKVPASPSVAPCSPPSRTSLRWPLKERPSLTASARDTKGLPSRNERVRAA
jgi:transposase